MFPLMSTENAGPGPVAGTRRLTARQEQILNCIRVSIAARGYPPSMREIGEQVGLASPSSVKHQLAAMEAKGYVRRDANVPRGIEVIDPSGSAPPLRPGQLAQSDAPPGIPAGGPPMPAYVPVLDLTAGDGGTAPEQAVDDVFPLPAQVLGDGDLFLLRVPDDSMAGAAIIDADWVVARRQTAAVNGDIVVALLRGEPTVKAYRKDRDHVWLLPRHPGQEPILADSAQVMGKVVAVLRAV